MSNQKQRWPLSKISTLHYIKLIYRSVLFLFALAVYIHNRANATGIAFGGTEKRHLILMIIWLIFVIEMVLRFFPSEFESMGCQKQFAANFSPSAHSSEPRPQKQHQNTAARMVATVWIIFNAAIGALYLFKVIDQGILLLIALVFSVSDMTCILFFCPFQVWIMKNKCCGTCRIYNWDYAMMFTPLLFIKSVYTWSLLALSLGLLLKWELVYRRHPERFSEAANDNLSCASCQEKLCRHKKSLRQFLRGQRMHFDHGHHPTEASSSCISDTSDCDL